MKKIYFLSISLLTCAFTRAQLTQSNHAPSVGDTYTVLDCNPSGVAPGASGAGATWNFATVTTNTAAYVYTASAVSSSMSTVYPNANVLVASSSSDNSYMKTSATGLYYYGGNIYVNPVSATLVYTAPAVSALYPMSLNTTSSSITGGSITATTPPANGTFSGTSSAIADGTGTLILPGTVTFSNVTRVVTSQNLTFTSSLVNGTVTQTNYEYFDPMLKGPIFAIRIASVATSFGAPTTQTIVLRTNYTPTSSTVSLPNLGEELSHVSVFPNPCSNMVNVNVDASGATLTLYDITGSRAGTFKLNNGSNKLDVSVYSAGCYIYTITGNNGKRVKTGKLTVIE